MAIKSLLQRVTAGLALVALAGCGPDYNLHTVVVSALPDNISPAADRTGFDRITNTVWRMKLFDENEKPLGARFLFFTRDGADWRAVMVDEKGVIPIPQFSPRATMPLQPAQSDRADEVGTIAPNLPMKLIPAKGGAIAQMQAGKLTLFGYYFVSSDGAMLDFKDAASGAVMGEMALGTPALHSTDTGIVILERLPDALAQMLTADPARLYDLSTAAEPVSSAWQASPLRRSRDMADAGAIEAMRQAAMRP